MILLSLILIPLIAGVITFFIPSESGVKGFSLLAAFATLATALYAIYLPPASPSLTYSHDWLTTLNSSFSLGTDGMAKVLVLLTAVAYPIIFIATWSNSYKEANQFYGLMLLTGAGMTGVFLATDCLAFYFFWELALIPAYFLVGKWGGERRMQAGFKFFVYTFLGSLFMLIGIIYVYYKTPDQSFAWSSFVKANITSAEQPYLFWFFFIAFAIKMPIFPFHTWQPDAYEQAPMATTMVLSGVMVKMGLFAVARWLLPVFPAMAAQMGHFIIWLAVIGMLYASLIAMRQNEIKRMIAYSSIAHIGLICAALFANNASATQGLVIQLFSHGVNVIGLWIVANAIQQQYGTTNMKDLGGLAQKAPGLTILLVVLALANISLPLTNAFIGEFLMFNGLFQYSPAVAAVAGISIILSAVYTLRMIQIVFLGEAAPAMPAARLNTGVAVAISIVVVMIFAAGVYPKPMFELGAQAMGWLGMK